MAAIRLNKVLRELNISLDRAVEFLESKGVEIEKRPTTKITDEVYQILSDEFETDASKKMKSQEVSEAKQKEKEALRLEREKELEMAQPAAPPEPEVVKAKTTLSGPKQVGKIDLDAPKKEEQPNKEAPVEEPKPEVKKEVAKKKAAPKKEIPALKEEEVVEEAKEEKVETQYTKLSGPRSTGEKIDLTKFEKPKKKPEEKKAEAKPEAKRKRRRISKVGPNQGNNQGQGQRGGFNKGRGKGRRPQIVKEEPSAEEVQKQVRETLEKLQGKANKGKGAKYRRDKSCLLYTSDAADD